MTIPRTRRILGNGPAMKPQLRQRYRMQEKATKLYHAVLVDEFGLNGWEASIVSEAVIKQVIANFKKDLSPRAANVTLPDSQILESMLFDAAVVAEQMDESGKLDEVLSDAQRREDAEKHGL